MSDSRDHFYDSVDALRLYCRVYESPAAHRVPVLCLPGLTRNSRDFAALAAHLRSGREVVAADLRGRGRSAWDPDPSHYQLARYVEDAWALLGSLSLDRVIVVGTSLGALMGMVMGATKPERIAGLVLNDAGAEIDPVGLRRIAGYVGKLPRVNSWEEAAAQTKRVYEAALPDLSDAQWMAYARCGYREGPSGEPISDMDPAIAQAFGEPSAAPVDLWPLYAQLTGVPLLVIRGAHSDLLSAATVTRMMREHPNARHIEVPNRGHAPLLDEPVCLAAIDAFLASHG